MWTIRFGYLHLWLNFTHSVQSNKGSFDIKSNSNMLVNIRKHFFTGCVIFLAWLTPRGCCVSPLGHGPGQFALGGPVWAGCRTTWPPEVPANLNHSVILWSCTVLSNSSLQIWKCTYFKIINSYVITRCKSWQPVYISHLEVARFVGQNTPITSLQHTILCWPIFPMTIIES